MHNIINAGVIKKSCIISEIKNLHMSVLKLVGFLSSCKNKVMKAHFLFYFIKLKTVISPCKGI